MKREIIYIWVLILLGIPMYGQTLEEAFFFPPRESKPLMIWQWMDGVITAEGITADLEAYKDAGIGGVQQFLVGGPDQGLICDTNAIGSENWKNLMKYAVNECERLGLTFGTHNCPGWSSSAFPTVAPEYSMQKLVWKDTIVQGGINCEELNISQSKINILYPFYRDIVLLAMPLDSIISYDSIIDLGFGNEKLPEGEWRVLRIGHTTNGKTNSATAPYGGVGLECDKMSREAVKHYWNTYPELLFSVLGEATGKTFQRLEIDSYEAGGQEWTSAMPQEFKIRKGYDIEKWLPVLCGYTIDSQESSKKFFQDYSQTGRELFTENYYGYMAELAHEKGLKLLYQPYGTNSSQPFNPIDTEGIARRLPDDLFCTEFWYQPDNWGWPSVPRHMDVAHRQGLQQIYAEGFTCWPLSPWQEDPASLKVLADRAFCLGVNNLMLHAGAQNPWKGRVPGMTFGMWGSWWTPGQTWWRSGAAKLLFEYFARCQSLLQRGEWVDDFKSNPRGIISKDSLQWTHRRNLDADIYFISNPNDTAFTTIISLTLQGKLPEIWFPETGEITIAEAWQSEGDQTEVTLRMGEYQSCFMVFRKPIEEKGPGLTLSEEKIMDDIELDGPWILRFPDGWDAPAEITLETLIPWNEHEVSDIRYFSGSATYENKLTITDIDRNLRYILDLGEVKNLAQVYVNGKEVAHLWKKPFRCEISDYIKPGENTVGITITNLWPNRMIGDEQYEDDVEWGEPLIFGPSTESGSVGRFMKKVPAWLANGEERPSKHRKSVISFKYFEKSDSLLPSGLLGPVELKIKK